jgi:hypothetical protein
MHRVLAPLLFTLCAASVALADAGPPAGKKSVPVTTVVGVAEDFPDYAFFEVSYSSRPGPPHGGTSVSTTLHFVVPGTTLQATGDRRSGGTLYAVPRAVVESAAQWKDFLAAFEKQPAPKHLAITTSDATWVQLAQAVRKGEIPGAASIRFGGSDDLPADDPRTEVTERYRVARTAEGVAFVREDRAEPAEQGGPRRLEKVALWRWVAAGIATAVALGLAGVLIASRASRRT